MNYQLLIRRFLLTSWNNHWWRIHHDRCLRFQKLLSNATSQNGFQSLHPSKLLRFTANHIFYVPAELRFQRLFDSFNCFQVNNARESDRARHLPRFAWVGFVIWNFLNLLHWVDLCSLQWRLYESKLPGCSLWSGWNNCI